jgi:uncharacterized protein
MPNVVFDASTLVGALLREGSVPERALLLARAGATICLSDEVEAEIREVFTRPKFAKYLTPGRAELILAVLTASAVRTRPTMAVRDCRDAKDNKYLELALSAEADTVVASDDDLLVLHPWRGVAIVTPAEFVRRFDLRLAKNSDEAETTRRR